MEFTEKINATDWQMSPGFANRFDNAMRGTCSNETQRFSEMCRDGNCHCRLQRMFTYSRNITVAEQATGGELKVSGTFSEQEDAK